MMKWYIFGLHHTKCVVSYLPITAVNQILYSLCKNQYTYNCYIRIHVTVSSFPLTVPPSAPSAISLLHCTGTEMVIGWRAPVNNGGEPVYGYYLDQREKSQSTWHEINVKPVKERVYTVSHSTSVLPSLQ